MWAMTTGLKMLCWPGTRRVDPRHLDSEDFNVRRRDYKSGHVAEIERQVLSTNARDRLPFSERGASVTYPFSQSVASQGSVSHRLTGRSWECNSLKDVDVMTSAGEECGDLRGER